MCINNVTSTLIIISKVELVFTISLLVCVCAQLDLFDSFFEANGSKAILFYYQDADTPVSGKSLAQ